MTSVNTAPAELRWVDPSLLDPNPWNPNRMDQAMFDKTVASVHAFGFVDPVTTRWLGKRHQIIDGEHRWRVSQNHSGDCGHDAHIGMTEIPIFDLGTVADTVAKQLTIVLNETRGQADPTKLGELLKDLMARETKESLLSTLPFSREAFDRLTGLPVLDWEDLELRRPQLSGQRPSAWVERTYRMPKEAAEVLDQAIGRVREQNDGELAEWQALELLAADFLGS